MRWHEEIQRFARRVIRYFVEILDESLYHFSPEMRAAIRRQTCYSAESLFLEKRFPRQLLCL